jgi:hypothetical protein
VPCVARVVHVPRMLHVPRRVQVVVHVP